MYQSQLLSGPGVCTVYIELCVLFVCFLLCDLCVLCVLNVLCVQYVLCVLYAMFVLTNLTGVDA